MVLLECRCRPSISLKKATLLARPEGASDGTRGLGLFVMPRLLEDGTPNHYRIVRLKDKLGTRSMASGEIRLEGAHAYQLGVLDAGFKQMAEMINWSRLSNGVKSAALMRRASHDAQVVSSNRQVFGASLKGLPLGRLALVKLLLPVEQALSMWMFVADLLDEVEYPTRRTGNDASAVLRLATPVLKMRATRDARGVTGDAMEIRGGCGYIEEFVTPRLVRDAHLGSIWEGTSNIVAIDAIRRAVNRGGGLKPYAARLDAKLDEADRLNADFRAELREWLARTVEAVGDIASGEDEAAFRRATSALYHVTSAVLMAWEGNEIDKRTGNASRALWARLVVDHRLRSSGPLDPAPRRDALVAKLMDGSGVDWEAVNGLLKQVES